MRFDLGISRILENHPVTAHHRLRITTGRNSDGFSSLFLEVRDAIGLCVLKTVVG